MFTTAVIIDGANLHESMKALNKHMDYDKLKAVLEKNFGVVKFLYFTAIWEDGGMHKLYDWLEYNGFTMITKQAKEYTRPNGERRIKGNMDVDMTIHAMELIPHVRNLFLFTGDGDFRPLVEYAQRRGVYVTVVSTMKTQPPMISDLLRRQADNFIDLIDFIDQTARVAK